MMINNIDKKYIVSVMALVLVILATILGGYDWFYNWPLAILFFNLFGLIITFVLLNKFKPFVITIAVLLVSTFGYNTYLQVRTIQIYNKDDFMKIEQYPKGNFVLMDDIELFNNSTNGYHIKNFEGNLEGNGFTIVVHENPLFDEVKNAEISNISIISSYSTMYSATIANTSTESTYTHIYSRLNSSTRLFIESFNDSFSEMNIYVYQGFASDEDYSVFAYQMVQEDKDFVSFSNIHISGVVNTRGSFAIFADEFIIDGETDISTIVFNEITTDLSVTSRGVSTIANYLRVANSKATIIIDKSILTVEMIDSNIEYHGMARDFSISSFDFITLKYLDTLVAVKGDTTPIEPQEVDLYINFNTPNVNVEVENSAFVEFEYMTFSDPVDSEDVFTIIPIDDFENGLELNLLEADNRELLYNGTSTTIIVYMADRKVTISLD